MWFVHRARVPASAAVLLMQVSTRMFRASKCADGAGGSAESRNDSRSQGGSSSAGEGLVSRNWLADAHADCQRRRQWLVTSAPGARRVSFLPMTAPAPMPILASSPFVAGAVGDPQFRNFDVLEPLGVRVVGEDHAAAADGVDHVARDGFRSAGQPQLRPMRPCCYASDVVT